MKKVILISLVLFTLMVSSCAVHTSDNVDIDANDIRYIKDVRTDLCYAIVASRQTMSTDATGLGMTCVPCEKVEKYLR